jgi:hypothetical protein
VLFPDVPTNFFFPIRNTPTLWVYRGTCKTRGSTRLRPAPRDRRTRSASRNPHATFAPPPAGRTCSASGGRRPCGCLGDVVGSSGVLDPRPGRPRGCVRRGGGRDTASAAGMAKSHAKTRQSKAGWRPRGPWVSGYGGVPKSRSLTCEPAGCIRSRDPPNKLDSDFEEFVIW